ncbi:MAG TPA: hypothetical protein VFK92_02485 [Burkholderiales bacterium]|nr:hypothetical protein [Burkholderiales bacterium]
MSLRAVRFALAGVALLRVLECAAGTTAGPVRVNVTLNNPAGQSALCTSQALSESTGAVVKVLCSNGQFVSISPRAGTPFAGVHGGAFTYYLGPAGILPQESRGPLQGAGTVTEYRVYSRDQDDRFVEVIVSF